MTIEKTKEGNTLIVTVAGRLDTITAPKLEAALEEEKADQIILEFENLEYISSAGLRVLLKLTKQQGEGGLIIRHPNEIVTEVFEVTGFSDVLTIEE